MVPINKNWSTKQCEAWIKSLELPTKIEKQIIKVLQECGYKGEDIMDMDHIEIKENFKVVIGIAKKIERRINEDKLLIKAINALPENAPKWNKQDNNSYNINYDILDNDNKINNDIKFNILFDNGIDTGTVYNCNGGMQFSTVLDFLIAKESWASKKDGFKCVNQVISSNNFKKTLNELNIQPNAYNEVKIDVIKKAKGGSKMKNNNQLMERQFTKNYLKTHKKLLNMLTFDKDIISLDDSKTLRAEMPCGCVVGPVSMFKYIENIFSYGHTTKVPCPNPKCKKNNIIWPFDLCSIVACMTKKEYYKYANIIQNRLHPKKRCPSCKIYVERSKDLKKLRVNCGSGKCKDFCYVCLNKWKSKSKSITICGNEKCPTYSINKRLKECKLIKLRKQISYDNDGNVEYKDMDNDVQIPELRACVNCLVLIEYTHACKHMTCPRCNQGFCFACLRKWGFFSGWPCGGYYNQCPYDNGKIGYIAPRQQFV